VNNAADQAYEPLLDVDPRAWERTLAVNVTGAMLTIRAAAPRMRAGAAIVNVASMHSFGPLAGAAAYATSKGALVALTRQAAVELGDRGIRVNAVAPGPIDTTDDEERRRPGAIRSTGTCRCGGRGPPRRSRRWSRSLPPMRPPT